MHLQSIAILAFLYLAMIVMGAAFSIALGNAYIRARRITHAAYTHEGPVITVAPMWWLTESVVFLGFGNVALFAMMVVLAAVLP